MKRMINLTALVFFMMLNYSQGQPPAVLPIETDKETPSIKIEESSQVSIITRYLTTPEVGKPCSMEITLKNPGALPLEELILTQEWNNKLEILEVNPKPFIQEKRWTWEMPELQPGAGKVFQFKVMALEKELPNFKPSIVYKVTSQTKIPNAIDGLLVQVQGPQWVRRGQRAVFDIVVVNHGKTDAENVTIRDKLPQGLRHPEGEFIEANLGKILPGQTKSIRLETLAVENGKFSQNIQVASSGGEKKLYQSDISVSDGFTNLLWKKSLEDTAKGELEMLLEGKIESFKPAASNLSIQAVIPEGLELIGSNPQARYVESSSNSKILVWDNPNVIEGKWTARIRLKAAKPGDWKLQAKAIMDSAAESSNSFIVRIEGSSAVQGGFVNAVVNGTEGNEAVVKFSLKNIGSTSLGDMGVRFIFPDGLIPVDWKGPTIAGLEGQDLNFDPLTGLESQVEKIYSVHVKSLRPGDFRLVVEYGTGNIKRTGQCTVTITPLP